VVLANVSSHWSGSGSEFIVLGWVLMNEERDDESDESDSNEDESDAAASL
jgi:hypothetical protein